MGKTSGAGRLPAKEMMSGCSVSLRSSRIIEAVMRCVLWAKRWFHRVSGARADERETVPSAISPPRRSSPAVAIDMGTPPKQGSSRGRPGAMMRTDQGEMLAGRCSQARVSLARKSLGQSDRLIPMSKRLQVLLDEPEIREIQRAARA